MMMRVHNLWNLEEDDAVSDFKDLQSLRGAVKHVIKVNCALPTITDESALWGVMHGAWRTGDSEVWEEVASELSVPSVSTTVRNVIPQQISSVLY